MTNHTFVLHDLANDTEISIEGYENYLRYFENELLPEGLGTRYMFAKVTKSRQTYHYRIVAEQPGYIGYVRNEKAIVR